MKVILSYSARDFNLAFSAAKLLLTKTDMPPDKFYLYGSQHAPDPHREIQDNCAGFIPCKGDAKGYPLGPNMMFATIIRYANEQGWKEPMFLMEADGFPTCEDWYGRVRDAHNQLGSLVSGSWIGWVDPPHFNGNLVIHPDMLRIAPWLQRVTHDPWDCFHAEVLKKHGWHNKEILNARRTRAYYPTAWWLGLKQADGHKPAWIHGCQNFQMWEHIQREGFDVVIQSGE